jgi:hypothetical protein
MASVTIRGPAGEVRWGYHIAASLGAWTVVDDRLTATVVSADDFKVSQRPLTFIVHRPSGRTWSWNVGSLQMAGETLTAVLAPVE